MNQYFKASEAENYVFYKVPKALFTDEKYKAVSTDAKMLYGLLLDRMHLPVKNGWTDKYGRVYQYFTVQRKNSASDMKKYANCFLNWRSRI